MLKNTSKNWGTKFLMSDRIQIKRDRSLNVDVKEVVFILQLTPCWCNSENKVQIFVFSKLIIIMFKISV